jgi:hypothetical protein
MTTNEYTPAIGTEAAADDPATAVERGRGRWRFAWVAVLAAPALAGVAAWTLSTPRTPTAAPATSAPASTTTATAPVSSVASVPSTTARLTPTPTASDGGGSWWTDAPAETTVPPEPQAPEPTTPDGGDKPSEPVPAHLVVADTVALTGTGRGTVTLTNDGGTSLNWAAAGSAAVTLAPGDGVLEPGQAAQIGVTVALKNRPTGPYSEIVEILSSGGDVEVTLKGVVFGLVAPTATTTSTTAHLAKEAG